MRLTKITILVALFMVLGITCQKYGIITHPSYWALYGAVFGMLIGYNI